MINAASLALARKLIIVSIDMETAAHANDVYQPRNPRASDYFKCTQAHFEQLEMLWDDRYQQRYGFWRPYVMDVINRYLDCGDLHCGFARVKSPIKHIYRTNQRIFGGGLANQLILLIPKFLGADEARKTWCGKYRTQLKKSFYYMYLYDSQTW